MRVENLIEQISSLDSFDEKSGVLANAVISSLDTPVSNAALMCGLIYWFNESVIKSFVNDDAVTKEAIESILSLPFVERKGTGFTFHESVKIGLHSVYEKEPSLTIKAYTVALPELLNNMDDDIAAITATYGLIATNDSRADDTISSIVKSFSRSHQSNKLKVFAQDMQEVLWLTEDNTLSDERWVQIGLLQLSNSKLDDAVGSFERALRVNPSCEDAFLLKATVSELKGDFDTALHSLNETILKFPKSAKAYLSRASLHILKEEYSHASSDYYKVLEIDPKSSIAYAGLANIFSLKGNKAKQLSLYKQAIDLDPENVWIYIARANILSDYEQYEEAISDFNKALEINSSIDLAFIGRANVYEKEKKYDLALADLQNALAINPDNVIAIQKVADIYYSLGRYHEALKNLQDILSINPELIFVYESLWKTCLKLGNIEQARRYFLQALNLPSQNSGYYFSLVLTARKFKEFELGILAIQKGLELKWDIEKFYVILGSFFIQIGELELAEININKASAFKNSKHDVAIYINLGIIRWLNGNKPAAWEMFQRAKQYIIREQKESTRFDNSKKNASKRRAIKEKASADLYVLGWVNIVMGQAKTGMSQIQQFITNHPNNVNAFLDLRDATSAISKLSDAPSELRDLQKLIEDLLIE